MLVIIQRMILLIGMTESKDLWNVDEIYKDKIMIDAENNVAEGKEGVCVGTVIISKATLSKTWKLKCLEGTGFGYFSFRVGIISTKHTVASLGWNMNDYGYGLDTAYGYCRHHKLYPNRNFKKDDIITMRYETVKDRYGRYHGELYFGSNEEDLKKGYDNIPLNDDEAYRFGVAFFWREKVQLL